MHLIDTVDEELIASNIPAAAKCRLFDYVAAPSSKKFDLAAAIAYELFSAEAVFSALAKTKCDFEQQKRFIIEHLTPSISPLPEQCSQLILYLVTYWDACITESALSKKLLHNLIEMEGKGAGEMINGIPESSKFDDVKIPEVGRQMEQTDQRPVPSLEDLKNKLEDIFKVETLDDASTKENITETNPLDESNLCSVTLDDGTVVTVPDVKSYEIVTKADDNGTVYLKKW